MKTFPLVASLLSFCSTTDAFSQPSSSSSRRGLVTSNNNNVNVVGHHYRAQTTTTLFSTATSAFPEGISKTTTVEGSGRAVRAGDVVMVKYFCSAAGSEAAFSRSDRQRITAGDGTMIRGWDAVIRTMREGERASILISDPELAYGPAGVPPFVPPNAQISIDLEVLGVEEGVGLTAQSQSTSVDALGNEGNMGMDGPINRPRTPGAIAAAYESRMREKEINAVPEREGIFGFIDWIKNSYFFGLFEGETGQEAPWYLKPSITFPIAFAVVGLAFAVSLLGGAISERGLPSTDELDEIIISSAAIQSGLVMAMTMIQV